MKIAILQSNYIPWKGYFDIIRQVDTFVLYDEVQYTKNDWRNRNMIKTNNGLQWLTIPVRQLSLEQTILETQVQNDVWKKKHISSLQTNYGKAAFFKEQKDFIFSLYDINSTYISEINTHFIKEICSLLGIKTKIIHSKELNLVGDKSERLVDACTKLNASAYLSGAAAKSYLNEELFVQKNIKVEWMDYSKYKEYPQLYPPFTHGVSIVDLIFNTGQNAIQFIEQ